MIYLRPSPIPTMFRKAIDTSVFEKTRQGAYTPRVKYGQTLRDKSISDFTAGMHNFELTISNSNFFALNPNPKSRKSIKIRGNALKYWFLGLYKKLNLRSRGNGAFKRGRAYNTKMQVFAHSNQLVSNEVHLYLIQNFRKSLFYYVTGFSTPRMFSIRLLNCT